VVRERRSRVVATAGHVDHGKSTLVRALTGMEPDRFAEERRRGMTIDLGFAWTDLPSGDSIAFVDVPGHERFVSTMLAGVGPVPAVVFVVAADEGWMPQSAEHLDVLDALGARHGLLVVTRSDLLDPALALAEAQEKLAASSLGELPAVAVSAVTGQGMPALRTALDELVAGLPEPDPDADVRLWVDRAFTIHGAGTVVTGTLAAGTLSVGEQLELGTRSVTVRGLQTRGAAVDRITGVARIAVNLRGVPLDGIERGDTLLTPGAWLLRDEIDVRLSGVADLPGELMLHIGSVATPARVRPLGTDTARLRLRTPLPLRIGDRAVLRDPGRRQVAAAATVLDVLPPALARRGAAARRASELAGLDGRPSATSELARRGRVRRTDLVAMGVDVTGLDAVTGGGWLVDPALVPALVAELRAALTAHDEADPLDPGLPVEAARRAIDLPDARLVDAVLARAAAPGLVVRDGRVRSDAVAALPARVREALDAVRADLAAEPFAAPDASRLAALGLGPKELATLVRAGELLAVEPTVVLLPGADELALARLRDLGPEFTLSAARQALRTSRRVAVPLLELLARTGRTARTPDGNHRLR
jgi:selenocysteine-specific elongation factor